MMINHWISLFLDKDRSYPNRKTVSQIEVSKDSKGAYPQIIHVIRPWLSIETHENLVIQHHFKKPQIKCPIFTDHASALAILLNCRLGDCNYVPHIDLGVWFQTSKPLRLIFHQVYTYVIYLSYWQFQSWFFWVLKILAAPVDFQATTNAARAKRPTEREVEQGNEPPFQGLVIEKTKLALW